MKSLTRLELSGTAVSVFYPNDADEENTLFPSTYILEGGTRCNMSWLYAYMMCGFFVQTLLRFSGRNIIAKNGDNLH